jgi:hypothetical protein
MSKVFWNILIVTIFAPVKCSITCSTFKGAPGLDLQDSGVLEMQLDISLAACGSLCRKNNCKMYSFLRNVGTAVTRGTCRVGNGANATTQLAGSAVYQVVRLASAGTYMKQYNIICAFYHLCMGLVLSANRGHAGKREE